MIAVVGGISAGAVMYFYQGPTKPSHPAPVSVPAPIATPIVPGPAIPGAVVPTPAVPPAPITPPVTPPLAAESLSLRRVEFSSLPGWRDDDQRAALPALRRSCAVLSKLPSERPVGAQKFFGTYGDWRAPCDALLAKGEMDRSAARAFFEQWFAPYAASSDGKSDGLFTGYFEAELKGTRKKSGKYIYPIYAAPPDLLTIDLGKFKPDLQGQTISGRIDGNALVPYFTRGEIDGGTLANKNLELFWTDDVIDLFILHIQGSGKVQLPDGKMVRVGFAAHNGYGYTSIGKALIDRGALKLEEASWPGIKAWLDKHPEEAAKTLAVNARYIFFRQIEGDGPIGAQGVALVPGRSLAVDTAFVPLGVPIWLDTVAPGESNALLQRLMVAQDKGAAIKGPIRGDFFWGSGAAALAEAGRMKSKGRWFLFLPRTAASAS